MSNMMHGVHHIHIPESSKGVEKAIELLDRLACSRKAMVKPKQGHPHSAFLKLSESTGRSKIQHCSSAIHVLNTMRRLIDNLVVPTFARSFRLADITRVQLS
jgi:hypothetical protein